MKVILFNVYDSFSTVNDFGWDIYCDLETQDFEIDNGYLCTDQNFIEAVENFKPYMDECFTFNYLEEYFNQNSMVKVYYSADNPSKEYLESGENFKIYSLPDNTTDCEVITRFDKEFKHLYQEAIYVVDGKIKHVGWNEFN